MFLDFCTMFIGYGVCVDMLKTLYFPVEDLVQQRLFQCGQCCDHVGVEGFALASGCRERGILLIKNLPHPFDVFLQAGVVEFFKN